MWIPGFGMEDLKPYKKASATEAHKQVGVDIMDVHVTVNHVLYMC